MGENENRHDHQIVVAWAMDPLRQVCVGPERDFRIARGDSDLRGTAEAADPSIMGY